MKTLSIALGSTYPLYIGSNLWDSPLLGDFCSTLNKRLVIITDSHLAPLLGQDLQSRLQAQGLTVDLLDFPGGEINKTRETKQKLEDALLAKQYGRDTALIALGGGVVTDLAGFLAATYCRGLPVIYMPTTLLAMVDASIGGKTGVNTPHGKNLIGAFKQPVAVFMDTATLTTLPAREWRNGIVEIIKHSVIADADLFESLEQQVTQLQDPQSPFLTDMIYASCLIKKNIVEQDEYEQTIRHVLNFGHTIGHAIETLDNYRISHGEAVAMGMLVEGYLSMCCGFLEEGPLKRLHTLLKACGLPLKTSVFQDRHALAEIMKLDKKAVKNSARFVLLDNIGQPHRHHGAYTMSVEPEHLYQALEWAQDNFDEYTTRN